MMERGSGSAKRMRWLGHMGSAQRRKGKNLDDFGENEEETLK